MKPFEYIEPSKYYVTSKFNGIAVCVYEGEDLDLAEEAYNFWDRRQHTVFTNREYSQDSLSVAMRKFDQLSKYIDEVVI